VELMKILLRLTKLNLQTTFASRFSCLDYVNKLPAIYNQKGYVTASIDSIHYDSTFANITLFVGQPYLWAQLDTRQIDPTLLNAVGWA
jgi:hypothetical protein